MSEESIGAHVRHRSRLSGCLLKVVIAAAVVTAIVIGIGFAFDQGTKAPATSYDAGPANEYPVGVVIPVESEHIFITRLQDGRFVAVYDKSPRQQELRGNCRVRYDTTSPALGSVPQLPGFSGAFVEECGSQARTVWLADGRFAFGAGYPGVNLDRYATRVDSTGNLIVDLASRSCTQSRGAIGVAPFDVQQCGIGD
ncbi:MAG: hypothetical protein IVW36_03140 [Dehalococcoidia bacterium]|nr:hypothetical protein [Dehalococcoidia bacterium]